jgi:hypothetical protein
VASVALLTLLYAFRQRASDVEQAR